MRLLRWLRDSFIETLNQTFTILGFFVAWVVMEGSARVVVGFAILWSLFVWLVSLPIREQKTNTDSDT
jgi:hypothetical protein